MLQTTHPGNRAMQDHTEPERARGSLGDLLEDGVTA